MTGFERMGGRRIRGRALGDRIGCAVMISLIRTELPYDTVFAFTTRYHSGGSEPIAVYHTRPERTLILGAAAADDIPGGKGECALGKGVVLPLSEQRTVYEKNFRRQAGRCALEKEIPIQQPASFGKFRCRTRSVCHRRRSHGFSGRALPVSEQPGGCG